METPMFSAHHWQASRENYITAVTQNPLAALKNRFLLN